MTYIKEQIEKYFDPTDADSSMQLAYASADLLVKISRALEAEEQGMRMGRDDRREIFAASVEVARKLNLLSGNASGLAIDLFFKKTRTPETA